LSTKNIAILIFANSSENDEMLKRIPNSRLLFRSLTADIIRKVEKTNLPFFLYNEKVQVGHNFGTRFTAAIESLFSKGFDAVITVGNDTPNLSVKLLKETHQNLRQGKTTIGPSADGGVYLLGLIKNKFNPTLFKQLPWQRRNLSVELLKFLLFSENVIYQLPRLNDIDGISDIKCLLNSGIKLSISVYKALLQFISTKINEGVYLTFLVKSIFLSTHLNKGSPHKFIG